MSYKDPKRIIRKAVRGGFHTLTNAEIRILAENGLAYEEFDRDERGNKMYEPCFTTAGYFAAEFAMSEMKLRQRVEKLKATIKTLRMLVEAGQEYFDTLLNDNIVLAAVVDYNHRTDDTETG